MTRIDYAAVLTSLAVAVLAAAPASRRQGSDEPPPPPPIKEIMGTLNKGPKALTSSIGRNLDRTEPDWRTLAEQCSRYVAHVEQLGRNVPPRGEPASWERLTGEYLSNARAMADAIGVQNREAALAVYRKIEQACARCHVDHKP